MKGYIPLRKIAHVEVRKGIPGQLMETKEAKKRDELIQKFKEEWVRNHFLSACSGEERGTP